MVSQRAFARSWMLRCGFKCWREEISFTRASRYADFAFMDCKKQRETPTTALRAANTSSFSRPMPPGLKFLAKRYSLWFTTCGGCAILTANGGFSRNLDRAGSFLTSSIASVICSPNHFAMLPTRCKNGGFAGDTRLYPVGALLLDGNPTPDLHPLAAESKQVESSR